MAVKVSIRRKMLTTFLVVLLLSMGTYLYLAIALFNEDKLAYIHDLNTSLVDSLSEQTSSHLKLTSEKMSFFARQMLRPQSDDRPRTAAVGQIFDEEQDILRISILKRVVANSYKRVHSFANTLMLEESGLAEDTLNGLHSETPLPLEAIASETDRLYLQNTSIPPDGAMLTMATSFQHSDGTYVIAVDFLLRRLLRIFAKSDLHETYLVDESGEILAHPNTSHVIEHTRLTNHPLLVQARNSKKEQGEFSFRGHDGATMLGAYAEVSPGRLYVLTQIPKRDAFRASREFMRRSVFFALAILSAALMVSTVFSRLITAPISKLSAASRAIGQGRFETAKVDIRSQDEIGQLARTFENMANELTDAQTQLVFSEKMAAFGQLGAGIAHEVKNPITGIIGFSQLALMNMKNSEKVQEYLKIIETESTRCSEILRNFLEFARQDAEASRPLRVNELVTKIAVILNHQLMINDVQLHMELDPKLDGATILGNPAGLQQVLLNLSLNAQQAMPEGGSVTLATERSEPGMLAIKVSDTGRGIPATILHKIFDPFFTTKKSEEGTGLGLSIVFSIVRDHKGRVTAESVPGGGSTFAIHLPEFDQAQADIDSSQHAPAITESSDQTARV